MKIGATSFAFRYAFLDPLKAPSFTEMIRQAREAGAERLQICENTRPLELSNGEWQEIQRCATDLGVELQLGCKTLTPSVFQRYFELAEKISCRQLRLVTEDLEGSKPPTREIVTRFLNAIVPQIQKAGMRLAVENYFQIPSSMLAELVSPYPENVVGFCVDTANSLRSFERTNEVLRLLNDRAFCYHLKDYRLAGSMVGFSISGMPLGDGDLDLNGCLNKIFENKPIPDLFVETWTPSENDQRKDVALDAEWLRLSIQNLRKHLRELK